MSSDLVLYFGVGEGVPGVWQAYSTTENVKWSFIHFFFLSLPHSKDFIVSSYDNHITKHKCTDK